MKFLCAVLFVVCILESYLVLDARSQTRAVVQRQDDFLNLNILAIRFNIKVANEITTNPAAALEMTNKFICGGNPFPDNFLNNGSVPEKTIYSLQSLKEEVAAHCKK